MLLYSTGGCGRFFEGTAEQMHYALNEVIAQLPPSTEIYCGHEYTKKNLEFALTVDANNENVKKKLQWAKEKAERKESTVPSTVAEEKLFNPFMRVDQESIANSVGMKGESPIKVMAALRAAKDKF
jgi:hydroxyacylglutathione hydrolase